MPLTCRSAQWSAQYGPALKQKHLCGSIVVEYRRKSHQETWHVSVQRLLHWTQAEMALSEWTEWNFSLLLDLHSLPRPTTNSHNLVYNW